MSDLLTKLRSDLIALARAQQAPEAPSAYEDGERSFNCVKDLLSAECDDEDEPETDP